MQILGAGAFALAAVHTVGSSGGECAVGIGIHVFFAQYRISQRPVIEVVEDAYSVRRSITPLQQNLELPILQEVLLA